MARGRRRYPRHPLIGVGAIILRRGRVLMVQRGKQPLKGWWSLPGGLLETGESLDAGVRREVREETGLEVRPTGVFEIFERIMRDAGGAPEYHYVLIDYRCRVTGGALRAGDDASAVEWVPRRDLPALQITEGTLAVIERAFQCGAANPGCRPLQRACGSRQSSASRPAAAGKTARPTRAKA